MQVSEFIILKVWGKKLKIEAGNIKPNENYKIAHIHSIDFNVYGSVSKKVK